ncbi:Murein DD-endopeptidase MepS/Murein LD-carboxypeptidase precursor [Falsiruegeria litorea R37]|uniref:Murein DD-endopeptidase MepS/Murein LD-carboxypeptidase n=1 Tax=Falsiruegeria litorea R37 TaxID=1200284 RepID=A0A1Y5SQA7_9RHOB|nr:NlpC/P60 family protein [Falsiruegeria litorea]SLN44651.1 Murein DD-endopeptidase MepS/Murein LD-carboxypeptidase precursor [Falsiruegeria litorea R37]
MTPEQSKIVLIARSWIGTPYVHQASTKGAGSDCLGLVRGVWRELFGQEPEQVPAYSMDWSEPQGEERMMSAACRHLIEARDGAIEAGDVLLFRMRQGAVAKHVGIVTEAENARFVHAYSGHGVVESRLSLPWAKRLVTRFKFPVEGS